MQQKRERREKGRKREEREEGRKEEEREEKRERKGKKRENLSNPSLSLRGVRGRWESIMGCDHMLRSRGGTVPSNVAGILSASAGPAEQQWDEGIHTHTLFSCKNEGKGKGEKRT